MLKISRLVDYSIVILQIMVHNKENCSIFNVKYLSEKTYIPEATVSKIMKILNNKHIVNSVRGIKGGYILKKNIKDINLMSIIEAIDGKIAITQCSNKDTEELCTLHKICPTASMWKNINHDIAGYLSRYSFDKLLTVKS